MKRLYLILILTLPFYLNAQECDTNEWIKSEYNFDASMLSLREMNSGTYFQSIIIPDSLINNYLKLLSSVFNLKTTLSDSIFNILKIHVFPDIPYKELEMKIDTNYSWVKTYLKDSIISGNVEFDSLTELYGFKLYYYYHFTSGNFMYIRTTKILNVSKLVNKFNAIEGLENTSAAGFMIGDGNDIETKFDNDTDYVTFSLGWGDCPAGCIDRHYWEFSVKNCMAQLTRSYGSPLVSVIKIRSNNIYLYPNPVKNKLNIKTPNLSITNFKIFNLHGQLVKSGALKNNITSISVENLSDGFYSIILSTDKSINRKCFIKLK